MRGETPLTTAQRIKRLLDRHGHSLREGARRTGVPRVTLARIMAGSEANIEKWVRRIAGGYGVEPASLLGGQDPADDLRWYVQRAPNRERFDMACMTLQERLRLTLEFLTVMYPQRDWEAQAAGIAGVRLPKGGSATALWEIMPPDLVTARAFAEGLRLLIGLPRVWFWLGLLEDEPGVDGLVGALPGACFRGRSPHRPTGVCTREMMTIAQERLGAMS